MQRPLLGTGRHPRKCGHELRMSISRKCLERVLKVSVKSMLGFSLGIHGLYPSHFFFFIANLCHSQGFYNYNAVFSSYTMSPFKLSTVI